MGSGRCPGEDLTPDRNARIIEVRPPSSEVERAKQETIERWLS